jgi:lipopolysaccharide biosynthesis glycosyltransferase
MNTALLTIAIGQNYAVMPSIRTIRAYAGHIGAKFILMTQPTAAGNVYYEKFFMHNMLGEYDRAIILDADVIVRNDCPSLLEVVPDDCVGMYDEHVLASDEEKVAHRNVMAEAFAAHGSRPFKVRSFYNGGVIVASRMHREVFRKPAELAIKYWDQPAINMGIAREGAKTHDIGYMFNRMPYVDGRVPGSRLDCHIIHYAGITAGIGNVMNGDLAAWKERGLA